MQRPPRTFADLKAGDKVWVFSMYYGYSKLFDKRPEIHYLPKEITVSNLDEYRVDAAGRPTHYLICEERVNDFHNSYGYIYEDDMKNDISVSDDTLHECFDIVSLSKEKLIKELKKFLSERNEKIKSSLQKEMTFAQKESNEIDNIFTEFINQIERV
jgi:hypothetical protein